MAIVWVDPDTPLPDPAQADATGLVAAGLDLSVQRLDQAYRRGLFPWFSLGDPVLWWSPDPRMVLRGADLHISHSLAKRVRQFGHRAQPTTLRVTLNEAFPDVIAHCAARGVVRAAMGAVRQGRATIPGQPSQPEGTWITPDIEDVYTQWHRKGRVHSVETWIGDTLAGGLYGVSLGRCFFGESMFSRVTDASKVALVYLVRYLQRAGVPWVDCQQETPHMASLGARPIPRTQFLALLAAGLEQDPPLWGHGRLLPDGTLLAAP